MDMSKKLQETYLPDQETRKSRVVIGLSGGMNSFVVAYLLKIQKYDLIGVTVAMNWDDFSGSPTNALSCHLGQPEMDHIKEFCHKLGIPHFVVKASDEFKEDVVGQWMGSRVTGTKPNPCWNCHDLRMKLLYQKMLELEAQSLATGHIAKLFKHATNNSVYVHTSNDEVNDQSSILSRVPNAILEKLILPLSDLQQKEIVKLGENFGVVAQEKKIKMHQCFDTDKEAEKYIETHVPSKYRDVGELIFGAERAPMGDHHGVYHHSYGQAIFVQGQKQNDVFKLSRYYFKEKKIEVARPEHFIRKKIFLNNCRISDETPWHEPLAGYLKLSESEGVECFVYPKNLSSALIELEKSETILEGTIVTILKKKGKNAKVFLTGKVRYIAEEPVSVNVNDEGNERAKVDYSRDI
jgi:tRNA U34 2-thiouridine synthase MnmA/TrmU